MSPYFVLRHFGRVVKAVDSNPLDIYFVRERRFKSCRCRSFADYCGVFCVDPDFLFVRAGRSWVEKKCVGCLGCNCGGEARRRGNYWGR